MLMEEVQVYGMSTVTDRAGDYCCVIDNQSETRNCLDTTSGKYSAFSAAILGPTKFGIANPG